ncbi:MAG: hypothetical protein ACI4GC_08430 [Acutalibacteraceae bacterium]
MKIKDIKKDAVKCVKKTHKKIKLLATVTVIAFTVYTLIPKSEKIKGVNPDGFIK